ASRHGRLPRPARAPSGLSQDNATTPVLPRSPPFKPATVGGTIFFTANDGAQGAELWKSDGTAAGTVMVADINPGANSACHGPCRPTEDTGTIFFADDAGMHGTELWKSDGTAAGTVMVADINPGTHGSNPNNLENDDDVLFFFA